jgi:gas vesicle protein
MRLDLDLLTKHLNRFADEGKLSPEEIGILADKSSSVDDFKTRLDELCQAKTGKNSLEILAGIGVRLPDTVNSQKSSNPSENSPLQNELVEVQKKIDNLNERDKS